MCFDTDDCGKGISAEFKLVGANYDSDPTTTTTETTTETVTTTKTASTTETATEKEISKIEIQYATKKNFKKNLNTKKISSGKTKVTLKKLKRRTRYFVRARYKYADGTTSNWNSVKKV